MNIMLKLITGETIICQLVDETDRGMLIMYPFKVNVLTESTQQGVRSTMYYSEWILGSEDTPAYVRNGHVITVALPSKQTDDDYLEALGKKKPSDPHEFNWDALDYKAPDDPSNN